MTAVTDDFNRADGAMGANWTTFAEGGGVTAPTILSNQLVGNVPSSSGESGALWNANTFANDQFAEFTVGTTALASSKWMGLITRAVDIDHYYLLIYFNNGGTPTLWIFAKTANNTYTSGASTSIGSFLSPGDVVRMEVSGTVVTGYVNGVSKVGWNDTSNTYPSGTTGVTFFDNSTGGSVDSWSGGDLGGSAPQTVNITGLGSAAAFGAVTAAPGGVTFIPAGLDNPTRAVSNISTSGGAQPSFNPAILGGHKHR